MTAVKTHRHSIRGRKGYRLPQPRSSPEAAAVTALEACLAEGLRRPMRRGKLPAFSIIDSTLREGEQFEHAYFDMRTKIAIAKALDSFGVEYIEVTNPAASVQSRKDCEAIARLGLRAKVLAHIRCCMSDARLAVQTGVQGVNAMIGTSLLMQQHSHGKDMLKIEREAMEVMAFLKSSGLEVRFSTEDSFRSRPEDILPLYVAMDGLGVDRIGIADTVGCASPREVCDLVLITRRLVKCGIEVHMHNDTSCAVANAYSALESGATHIDTCVLGIGERNGITSLGAFIARLAVVDMATISHRFRLKELKALEQLVADATGISIPFNNCITGSSAFTHKAGLHTKAILNNPETYEILDPSAFGIERNVCIASRLTGWNSLRYRAQQLRLNLTDDEAKAAAQKVKIYADEQDITLTVVDRILRDMSREANENIQSSKMDQGVPQNIIMTRAIRA